MVSEQDNVMWFPSIGTWIAHLLEGIIIVAHHNYHGYYIVTTQEHMYTNDNLAATRPTRECMIKVAIRILQLKVGDERGGRGEGERAWVWIWDKSQTSIQCHLTRFSHGGLCLKHYDPSPTMHPLPRRWRTYFATGHHVPQGDLNKADALSRSGSNRQ